MQIKRTISRSDMITNKSCTFEVRGDKEYVKAINNVIEEYIDSEQAYDEIGDVEIN